MTEPLLCYLCCDPEKESRLIVEPVCECRNQPVHESCLHEMQRAYMSNMCCSCRRLIKKEYQVCVCPTTPGHMERIMNKISFGATVMCIFAAVVRLGVEIEIACCFLFSPACVISNTEAIAVMLDHAVLILLITSFSTFCVFVKMERSRLYHL
jgi:hypothetical protein